MIEQSHILAAADLVIASIASLALLARIGIRRFSLCRGCLSGLCLVWFGLVLATIEDLGLLLGVVCRCPPDAGGLIVHAGVFVLAVVNLSEQSPSR